MPSPDATQHSTHTKSQRKTVMFNILSSVLWCTVGGAPLLHPYCPRPVERSEGKKWRGAKKHTAELKNRNTSARFFTRFLFDQCISFHILCPFYRTRVTRRLTYRPGPIHTSIHGLKNAQMLIGCPYTHTHDWVKLFRDLSWILFQKLCILASFPRVTMSRFFIETTTKN